MRRSLGLKSCLKNGNKIDETYHVVCCVAAFLGFLSSISLASLFSIVHSYRIW